MKKTKVKNTCTVYVDNKVTPRDTGEPPDLALEREDLLALLRTANVQQIRAIYKYAKHVIGL